VIFAYILVLLALGRCVSGKEWKNIFQRKQRDDSVFK
jgi:hypothetical protein